jgi:hypothetical protein
LSDIDIAEPATEEMIPDVRAEQAAASAPPEEMQHRDGADPGSLADTPADVPSRPEWLQEQFWDEKKNEPKTETLATSYAELRKQFNHGQHKAPDGDYDVGQVLEAGVEADDPLLTGFSEWAKEYGISQHAFAQLADLYVANGLQGVEDVQRTVAEEKSMLGPKAEDRIQNVANYVARLHSRGVLTDDEFQEARLMSGSATGVKVMEKLQRFYGEQQAPLETQTDHDRPSREEIRASVGDPRYKTDEAYRARVQRDFDREFGTDPIDSNSMTVPLFS